jgi:hypothetical protein
MTDQTKAERLADALDAGWCPVESPRQIAEAAAELRRLSTVNAELLEAVRTLLPIAARVIQGTTDGEPMLKQARAAIARATEE